jgi:nucleoside-diphosphate-sugar epimerase
MTKILITGGAGFIGSHLAQELFRRGSHPVILDNLNTGKKENLDGIPHTFIAGDVRDAGALARAVRGCEAIYHLAALTSVAESMQEPLEYIKVNAAGTVNVLKAASENNVKKLVYASSAAVYGDSQILPKTEEMKPEPQSPYAITKELLESRSDLAFVPERPGEIKHSCASAERILNLGFSPEYSLEEGLRRTIMWFRDRAQAAS